MNDPNAGQHYWPAGTLADGPWQVDLTPKRAGWEYSALRVVELTAGASQVIETGEQETVVLPLAARDVRVEIDGEMFSLRGRSSVFDGPSDFVYLPRDARAVVYASEPSRIAFPAARCERRLSARYGPAAEVPVELRGAGQCSRQVHSFCGAGVFEADNLIAVEVLTPGGNWSSYPPHKHDEDVPGEECPLEEVYYFEIADGPGGAGMAYQRVYSSPGHPIDVLAEVRGGDVVVMPHGWHGPSMAVPGYDLYYLNVMAGPGEERAWLIRDDPAHGWIRQVWEDQEVDPRLPFGRA